MDYMNMNELDNAKAEGIKEGKKQGGEEKTIEISKNLLDILDDETISIKTGLSIEMVKTLRCFEVSNTDLSDEIRQNIINDSLIVESDDRSIQRLLREIDCSVLAIYLKYSNIAIKKKFLSNVSKRLREMLIEDMESMGRVRDEDIQKARVCVYNIYEKLVEAGEIIK